MWYTCLYCTKAQVTQACITNSCQVVYSPFGLHKTQDKTNRRNSYNFNLNAQHFLCETLTSVVQAKTC